MSEVIGEDVRYVVEVRVQRVVTRRVPASKPLGVAATHTKQERDITELGHFTLSESELASALEKGAQALKLTGV